MHASTARCTQLTHNSPSRDAPSLLTCTCTTGAATGRRGRTNLRAHTRFRAAIWAGSWRRCVLARVSKQSAKLTWRRGVSSRAPHGNHAGCTSLPLPRPRPHGCRLLGARQCHALCSKPLPAASALWNRVCGRRPRAPAPAKSETRADLDIALTLGAPALHAPASPTAAALRRERGGGGS